MWRRELGACIGSGEAAPVAAKATLGHALSSPSSSKAQRSKKAATQVDREPKEAWACLLRA